MGRLKDMFSRKPKETPKPRKRNPRRGQRSYDAAATGYRTDGWITASTSADSEVAGGLVNLRNRSRDLVRNSAWGRAAVDKLVSNIVGPGIRPTVDTGSQDLDRRILDLWESWSKECYPSNRSTVYTLQGLLVRAWVESGEVLIRRRQRRLSDLPGLPPLQLQILEADMLDHTRNEGTNGGGRIVQGVEYDALDRRRAYLLHQSHPGDTYSYTGGTAYGQTVRVPSSEILHLFQELRPGQTRGVPWMHSVIQPIWDLAGYSDAERVRAKAAACITAFVTGGDPDEGVPEGVDGIAGAEDDLGDIVTDGDGNPVEQLRPGWIAYLPDGKDIKVTQPGTPGGYEQYLSTHLHEIAAGLGLSYEVLTGDLSKVNFASIRLGLNEQRRLIKALRTHVFIPFVMDPVWAWFCDAAVAAGLLPDRPEVYKVIWSQPQIESVDRLTDAKADLMEMRIGTRSRREIIAAAGRDPDDVDSEIYVDQIKRDELDIVLDSDPSQTTLSGGLQPLLDDDPDPSEE